MLHIAFESQIVQMQETLIQWLPTFSEYGEHLIIK